ncbi:MAG: rod shape-determining protein MreC [Sphingomonadales bacterium]
MAAPAMEWSSPSRRPSAIRREQNLALLGAVVSGAVIATGLLLLLVARVNPSAGERLRAAMMDIVAPVWSVVRAPFDGAARVAGDASDYAGAVDRARRLEQQLDLANQRLRAAAADARALSQLRKLMQVQEPRRVTVATTRIVAATSGSISRTAMISAGSANGVQPGQPVIGTEGLIGRTMEAGQFNARVLLLTDPASRVPVIVQRTGQPGIAAGGNRPVLSLIDRVGIDVPLLPGDRIVTSGDGGVFPPGVLVGLVVDAGAAAPLLRPAASPMGAGYVRVEQAYLRLPAEASGPVYDAPVPAEARVRGAPMPRLRDTPPAIMPLPVAPPATAPR